MSAANSKSSSELTGRRAIDGRSKTTGIRMAKAKKPSDLNLDLINMVQQARMLHDATARPSALAAVYWIEAKRARAGHPPPTAPAGEWRIPLTSDTADAVWERVKALTVAGELGYKSKVSTRPAAGQADPDARMLCVRTDDAGDAEDIARVRSALRKIGLNDMAYVADKPSHQTPRP